MWFVVLIWEYLVNMEGKEDSWDDVTTFEECWVWLILDWYVSVFWEEFEDVGVLVVLVKDDCAIVVLWEKNEDGNGKGAMVAVEGIVWDEKKWNGWDELGTGCGVCVGEVRGNCWTAGRFCVVGVLGERIGEAVIRCLNTFSWKKRKKKRVIANSMLIQQKWDVLRFCVLHLYVHSIFRAIQLLHGWLL